LKSLHRVTYQKATIDVRYLVRVRPNCLVSFQRWARSRLMQRSRYHCQSLRTSQDVRKHVSANGRFKVPSGQTLLKSPIEPA